VRVTQARTHVTVGYPRAGYPREVGRRKEEDSASASGDDEVANGVEVWINSY
jgi:hypothetical protein